MTPEDVAAEVTFCETRWAILKDEELKALTRGDHGDEAACSRLRDYLSQRVEWLKGKIA